MIPSPYQKKELTGLALQMKMMADLLDAHKQFNEGIVKLAEYAKTIRELPKGQKGDTPHIDYERIAREAAKYVRQGQDGKDADEEVVVEKVSKRIRQPKDGETPVVDEAAIAKKAAELVQIPALPEIDHDKLAEILLGAITKKKLLKVDHIDGLRPEIDSYRNQLAGKVYGKDTMVRGGGDTVAAGTNVTITTDTNGKKVISASGGGSFSVMVPTGTINGSNKVFVFTSAPAVIVLDNGNAMNKVSADGTVNWTGTTTVTLAQAPNFNIFGY